MTSATSFTTEEGVVVTIAPSTNPHVYHPVGAGQPVCKSDWAQVVVDQRPLRGAATKVCAHGRMFVTPDFPVGMVAVLLHQHAVAAQVRKETEAPVDAPPLPDLLAARQKGTPPET